MQRALKRRVSMRRLNAAPQRHEQVLLLESVADDCRVSNASPVFPAARWSASIIHHADINRNWQISATDLCLPREWRYQRQ